MKTFLAILFSATACWGQADYTLLSVGKPAAAAEPPATWYPTNIQPQFLLSWWSMDNAIINGASITNVPNSWTVKTWPLTNQTTGTAPTISNNWLNGHAVAVFDGSDDWLRQGAFTNNYPGEYVMVVHRQAHKDWTYSFSRGLNRTDEQAWFSDDDKRNKILQAIGNSSVKAGAAAATNQWYFYAFSFNGTSSLIVTNGATEASGTLSTTDGFHEMAGITIGATFNGGEVGGKMLVAEIVVWETNLTSAERTQIWTNMQAKYGL